MTTTTLSEEQSAVFDVSQVIPARGVPVAKVISYTKKYEDSNKLVGAECHQIDFNGLSKYFYTYHFTKNEKKKYWKHVSHALENRAEHFIRGFQSLKDAKKRGIPYYKLESLYVSHWGHFNPQTDIVIGIKK